MRLIVVAIKFYGFWRYGENVPRNAKVIAQFRMSGF